MAFRTENNPSALAVALLAALTIVLSVITFLLASEFTALLVAPTPTVAQVSGAFYVVPSGAPAVSTQEVRITHRGGDRVPVDQLTIFVQASGAGGLSTDARLVDLPANGRSLDAQNIRGNVDLVDTSDNARLIVAADSNTWSAGRTIAFQVNASEADFRPARSRTGPAADTLAVRIVHPDTNVTLYSETFHR